MSTPKAPSMLGLLAIVAVVALGLVAIVRLTPDHKPKQDQIDPGPALPSVVKVDPNKIICDNGGGKWVECGNPCQGKTGACTNVCEPQCLCGGDKPWTCPAVQTCTQFANVSGQQAKVGICRTPQTQDATTTAATSTNASANMFCDSHKSNCVNAAYAKGIDLITPIAVTGTTMAFENTVNWRLEDPNGKTFAEGVTIAVAPFDGDGPAVFTIRAFPLQPPTSTGVGALIIFEYSAKDGEPVNEVRIPLRIKNTSTITSHIFLYSSTETDCLSTVSYPIKLIKTQLPIEATLRSLLAFRGKTTLNGTTLQSQIPDGTELISIKVSAGTANVVFNRALESYGGGSCNVGAISSQIENTLLQFPSIKYVQISSEGQTPETSLQP